MKLFNRGKQDTTSYDQEYYQSGKHRRVSVAWLLAFATVVTTLLLTLGLFYGGRWVYRSIFDNNKSNTTINQPTNVDDQGDKTQSPVSAQGSGTVAAPTTTQSSNTATNTPPVNTPTTGPLPSTGPDLPL